MDTLCNIVSLGSLGIFAVTCEPAVYIYVNSGGSASQGKVNILTVPLFGHIEGTVIDAGLYGVRQLRRLRIGRCKIVGNIGINRVAVALDFPVSGHADAGPVCDFCDIGRDVTAVFIILEVPGAVKVDVVRTVKQRTVRQAFYGRLFRIVEEELRPLRLGIDGYGIKG